MGSVELSIRTGAPVECRDGYLGKVHRVETDDGGTLTRMHVRRDDGSTATIDESAIVDVRGDGTIVLSCSLAEQGGAGIEPTRETREHARGDETLRLREEQLVAHKRLEQIGHVKVRKVVDKVPGRVEVEALREHVDVERVPVGEVVAERVAPWEEDGVMVVPVYEEQLVVTKQLVLKEHLRVRKTQAVERQVFEETLLRERAVLEDTAGVVRER